MKSQTLLDNYYLPGEQKKQLYRFAGYCNHERYHESPDNLTPNHCFIGATENTGSVKKYTRHAQESALRQAINLDELIYIPAQATCSPKVFDDVHVSTYFIKLLALSLTTLQTLA